MTCGTLTVRVTSIVTVATSRNWNETFARSRKPSPLGLTVVSRAESPAKRVDPLLTCRLSNWGGCESIRSGAVARIADR